MTLFWAGWIGMSFAQVDTCQTSFTFDVNGYTVDFTNTSSVTGPNFQGAWSFGDNSQQVNLSDPTHTFAAPGIYVVCLQNFSFCPGLSPYFCDTIVIQDTITTPQCNLDFDVAVNGLDVTITNLSTSDFSTDHVWEWDFGDGTTNTSDMDLTYSYGAEGTYTICLTATSCVCTQQIYTHCETVTLTEIADTCEVAFDYEIDSTGNVSFTNESGAGFSNNYYFNWNFGDGTNTTSEWSPNHTYSQSGVYEVCFQAVSCECPGQLFETCETIVIDLEADSIDCTEPSYVYTWAGCGEFYFSGTNNSGGGTPCWYLDGQFQTIGSDDFQYTFTENGTYEVCYNVLGGPCGFNTSYCDTIVVDCFTDSVPCEQTWISYASFNCPAYTFYGSNPLDSTDVPIWSIDGYVVSSGSQQLDTILSPGSHEICYFIQSAVGNCYLEHCETIFIDCVNLPCDSTYFVYTNYTCSEYYFQGTNTTNPNDVPYWSVDGVYVNSGSTVLDTNFADGTHFVCYFIQSATGACILEHCETIFVDCFQDTIGNNDDCIGIPEVYTLDSCNFIFDFIPNNGVPPSNIEWFVNGQSVSTNWVHTHTFTTAGTYQITVVVETNGCVQTYTALAFADGCNTITPQPAVPSISQDYDRSKVILFPNPAFNDVEMRGVDRIEVFDAFGKLLIESESNKASVSTLENGQYLVKGYKNGSFLATKKLIVRN